ncbi:hypothetical protein PMAYCL1PPCAC_15018, partial [Pristionchus mayeri]
KSLGNRPHLFSPSPPPPPIITRALLAKTKYPSLSLFLTSAGPHRFPSHQLIRSAMASSRSEDVNVSTISLAGSSRWVCQQCEDILANAQERERELMEDLETARALAARYKAELTAAQSTIQKMIETAHISSQNGSLLHKVETPGRRMSLQRQWSDEPKEGNVFSRRRSSVGYASIDVEPLLLRDAPPSFEEKKWWKGEGPPQPCPRGCYYLEGSRRAHYIKRHYNAYYAFVNSEDNYSERDRWLCTLFGDK